MVELTFFKGRAERPVGLLHSSLGGRVRRAIDIRELDAAALKDLVREAVALNRT